MLTGVIHVAPDRARYARQLRLPGVGVAGQDRLGAARVAVVGAGGLGSPVLSYLAAGGVGQLTVIDPDVVELSNLHRQLVHDESSVGLAKTESAAAALLALNSAATVRTHSVAIDPQNARDLLAGHDVVVDASDSFDARYATNDAAVALGIPMIWAAIDRFAGQVGVFWAGRGPCYRCIFPAAPAPGTVATCAEAGVLGALPGVVGSVQALETLKILLGIGQPLLGRVQCYDALRADWSALPVRRDPSCPVCGDVPDVPWSPSVDDEVPLASLAELADHDGVLLDVRTDEEYAAGHLPSSVHLPLDSLLADGVPAELTTTQPWIVYCQGGTRSAIGVRALADLGIPARSLEGGYAAWLAAHG
ncbi:adenylyltransferase/sulfurtransferase [Branchiibius hedensis]|uniref:Adenylyltransferase and sulfurtransferase n=1 Tax=Branchiibius hedensis TaxID=672460 RepID=A0A2Y8ZS62_9MICO|nr:adenylyltransferase/sulfurtransferase [Branchiibius hedensis]SSA33149.1 adenylyltransferase and sulfurtransferase [Branchiibius hedensis]